MGSGGNGVAAEKPLNGTFQALPTTIFTVMTDLAIQHKSINLGQGFPDDEGPASMKDMVGKAVSSGPNQYTNLFGIPNARQAVARHSQDFSGLSVDWKTQTLLTSGATEALAAAFLAFINPGDEVIILDPMYDAYAPMAARAGAVVVPVKLDPRDWSIPHAALEEAFSHRTKLILINTPHNPTGKVFSKEDLEVVARLVEKYNAYAILDEVYQHVVFEGVEHNSLRSLPGMEERAIRIGSAGKTFSFTGWKIGWVTGPARLISAIAKAHQFLVFCLPGILQQAVGYGLDNERSFFKELGSSLQRKRLYLEGRLTKLGFLVLPAQGTYFLVADFRPLAVSPGETDVAFAMRLTTGAGVTVIPVSAFYVSEDKPQHLVRFCFCKDDEKLEKAADQMELYFKKTVPTNGHKVLAGTG